jgi:hypothetical protein
MSWGTFRCWILEVVIASTLESTLITGYGTLDAADVVGTSSWRASDAMDGTTTISALASLGMTCIFSNFILTIEILVTFMQL